jgi:hypothetical protein
MPFLFRIIIPTFFVLEISSKNVEATLFISPVSAFQAWYRKGMIKTSLKNYSSAINDLEVALNMEVTSLGKRNIEQEIKLILQKQENVNEVGTSYCDSKDGDLPLSGCNATFYVHTTFFCGLHTKLDILFGQLTGKPSKVLVESISTPNKGRGMASTDDIPPASLIHVEDPLTAV